MKIITIVDLEGMPEGSVLQDAVEVTVDGVKCWRGMWSSMYGSYMETVSQTDAEEWTAEKHDPLHGLFPLSEEMKASQAYQALLKLWKKETR